MIEIDVNTDPLEFTIPEFTTDGLSKKQLSRVNTLLTGKVAKKKSWTRKLEDAAKKLQKLTVYSAADDLGFTTCITCGKRILANNANIQGGHFASRRHKMTLLIPANVNPQCSYCNDWLSGAKDKYREYIGAEMAEWLTIASGKTHNWDKPGCWDKEKLAIYVAGYLEPGIKAAEIRLGLTKGK